MAGVFEGEGPVCKPGDAAVEIDGEFGFGEEEVEDGDDAEGCLDGAGEDAEAICEFFQDAVDFAVFLFLESDEFVVEIDGFERFQKEGLAGVGRSVDDAGEFAALPGDDGDDEAVVANRYVLFLQDAFVAVGADEPVEGIVNRPALLFHFAADAVEMGAGGIEDGAVGGDFTFEDFEERIEVADGVGAAGEKGEAFAGGGEEGFGVGGAVEKVEDVEEFAGFESGAFDAEFVDGLGDVGEAVEVDANRGAGTGALDGGGGAQVSDGFAGFGEVGLEEDPVFVGFDGGKKIEPEGAGDIAGKEGFDVLPFESFDACDSHSTIVAWLLRRFERGTARRVDFENRKERV